MFSEQSKRFIGYFVRVYPIQTASMVGLLLLAGLAEGVGIAALLPVLETVGGDGSADDPVANTLITMGIEPTLLVLLTLIVLSIVLKAVFRWLAMRHVGYTVARVARDLRVGLIRALMTTRWTYFTSQPAGHFANAVSNECFRASQAYRRACSALAGVIQGLVYATIIVAISWKLAFFALVLGGSVAVVFGLFIRMGRIAGGVQTEKMKALVSRLGDALQGIKSIKAMAREDQFRPILEEDAKELERAEQRQVIAQESLNSLQEPLIVLVIAIGLYAALRWAEMTFSSVILSAFLFHRLTGRFHYVQGEYQGMAIGESAFWSLHSLSRKAEVEHEDVGGGLPPPPLSEEVRLENVTFGYDDEPVLRNVSLSVPAGSFTALVGPSGAGKTTVVDLIVGLHQPQRGRILVDGLPLSELDLIKWRSMIGYVSQETLLFHDTVRANITLGDEAVGRENIEEVLKAAEAWGFVKQLAAGLDTVVGERGTRLSGGQRQRIAIARALLGSPRILILDEATTALDPATEASICATLRRLRGEVTILSISHQSAMRGVADVVYAIDGGRIRVLNESTSQEGARLGWIPS